ncbi:MAG: hypothetical protein AAFM92_10495 [Pseudomonadota bacterium]
MILSVGWTFKGWYCYPQPSVAIESKTLRSAFRIVFGRKADYPPVRYRYQQLWQRTRRGIYRPTFWEDVTPGGHPDEMGLAAIPSFIRELVADYSEHIAPRHDFEDEVSFLRSLPDTFTQNGFPMQAPLMFCVSRMVLGDMAAVERLRDGDKVPPNVSQAVAAEYDRMVRHAERVALDRP